MFSLDPVAREIWQAVQRTGSVENAVSEVLSLYRVDEETLRRESAAFFESIAGSRFARERLPRLGDRWFGGIVGMNRFAAFWQSAGIPPDPETVRVCGGELARPAGACLQAGVRHNLAYVVASWSLPSIDNRITEALAFDDEAVLLADARLDDRRSLAANLSRSLRCEIPAGISDAQMLLYAWRAWGESLRQRVIGDYAFVVADCRARSLFAARSHPGWRPLFYAKTRAGVLVASNIDALGCHPEVSARPCDAAISAFLAFDALGRGDPGTDRMAECAKSLIRRRGGL